MSAAVAAIPDRPTPSTLSATLAPTSTSVASAAARVATYSGLILFFELAFIRYTSAYVRELEEEDEP